MPWAVQVVAELTAKPWVNPLPSARFHEQLTLACRVCVLCLVPSLRSEECSLEMPLWDFGAHTSTALPEVGWVF